MAVWGSVIQPTEGDWYAEEHFVDRVVHAAWEFVCPGSAFLSGVGRPLGRNFRQPWSGILADGSTIVGWSYSASGLDAFRWTASGGIVELGGFVGASSFFDSLSAAYPLDMERSR